MFWLVHWVATEVRVVVFYTPVQIALAFHLFTSCRNMSYNSGDVILEKRITDMVNFHFSYDNHMQQGDSKARSNGGVSSLEDVRSSTE